MNLKKKKTAQQIILMKVGDETLNVEGKLLCVDEVKELEVMEVENRRMQRRRNSSRVVGGSTCRPTAPLIRQTATATLQLHSQASQVSFIIQQD